MTARRCSVCGRAGHDRRAHPVARRNPARPPRDRRGRFAPAARNPDFFHDAYGRIRVVRASPNYDDGAVGRSGAYKKGFHRAYGSGPRGGYTWEEPGRAERAAAARITRKERSRAGIRSTAAPAFTRGQTAAQKGHARDRRYRLMGAA